MKQVNGNQQMRDLIVMNRRNDYKAYHPTQKPTKLMRLFIQLTTNEGDIVLDPFLGGGTVAVACKQLDRKCIGYEINPQYCKIATERLTQEKLCFPETTDFLSPSLNTCLTDFSTEKSQIPPSAELR